MKEMTMKPFKNAIVSIIGLAALVLMVLFLR